MKRTLSALAIVAAALASASVYAQNPQPSFQDSAPVPTIDQPQGSSVGGSALSAAAKTSAYVVDQNFPKPSFGG
jgi:hypothetical protein